MTDVPEFSPEMIDMAWERVHLANEAYGTLQEVRTDIAAVKRVSRLALRMEGIAIEPDVLGHLEAERIAAEFTFDRHVNEATPVMTAEDSPFVVRNKAVDASEVNERTFATGAVLRDSDELKTFARFRGYDNTQAARAWGLLSRNSTFVDVGDFAQYSLPEKEAEPSDRPLTMARVKGATWRDYEERLDVHSLYHNVRQWVEEKPDIKHLGPVVISFLADYTNHALPQQEKLRVDHQPRSHREIDYSAEGLLDTVHIAGTDEEVVTGKSLMRHAVSRGDTPQSAPPFTKILASIAKQVLPHIPHRQPDPQRVGEDWVYMGPNKTNSSSGVVTVWGMTPNSFRSLVSKLEDQPKWRGSIPHLSERGFEVMKAFVQALDQQESTPQE
jgi:hypothetical protein